MSFRKRAMTVFLVLSLALGLCACGGQSTADTGQTDAPAASSTGESSVFSIPIPEPEQASEPEPTPELTPEGEYTLFAMESSGYRVDSEATSNYSVLTLEENGGGTLALNDQPMTIEHWNLEGDMLSIFLEDGGEMTGRLDNGVLLLELWEGVMMDYAKQGADLSAYPAMSREEYLEQYALDHPAPDSLLYALWSGLDPRAGIHLHYEVHRDYMDSTQIYDVHSKDGTYYSERTTLVSGYESTTITFFQDGVAYNLDPADHTGIIATQTTSSVMTENIMGMDSLYSDIRARAEETDYTEETREVEGRSYRVEVYPAESYQGESAFYFDDQGQLAFYLESPSEDASMDLGESFYTIYEISDHVNDSLLDISGYTITNP